MKTVFGLLLTCAAVLSARAGPGKKVFCYYSSFAQNLQGTGKFLPEDIDPFLCTHVIFAFADIDRRGTDLMAINRNYAGPSGLYERTIALKEQNPALKVLLAVGGWQIGSRPFIPMVRDSNIMRRWIKNVVAYLRSYMDYMLLMTYNYHGQWEKRTGHHSPLWKHRNDPPGEQSELFQNWSIDYWLYIGVPKEKLIVGLATYGMSFTLVDPAQHGVHSPARGGGRMGKYTKETGIMSYYEVCQNIQNNGWKTGWINDQGAPYAYGGDQWVGYDNIKSIKMKADNIVKRGLAGAFVWSVEMDDFNGVCGDGKYPLLSTITRVLKPYQGLAKAAPAETKPKMTSKPVAILDPSSVSTRRPAAEISRKLAFSKGARVTSWTKPKWRPWNTKASTKNPWWKKTTTPTTTTTTTTTTSTTAVRPHWNARPTGRPHPTSLTHTTDSRKRTPWEKNSVHEKSLKLRPSRHGGYEEEEEEEVEKTRVISKPWHRRKRQMHSSAGAQGGGSINCGRLGSGLFAHPHNCERFVMCIPESWRDYPPHIMTCPPGTLFDDRIKVCNHATSVEC